MSVKIIAEHAGTVMDTLFCAVGSVGSLGLLLAQAGFHTGTSRVQETHQHEQRTRKEKNIRTEILFSSLGKFYI